MTLRPHSCLLAALLLLSACATGPATQAPPLRPIGQVQGTGARSLLLGQVVSVQGVVTADLRGSRGGIFLQDGGDGDAATSDGLFVAGDAGTLPATLAVGQTLRVQGTVQELGEGSDTLTALHATRALQVLPPMPEPAAVVLDAPPADWEALEGMRVEIRAPLALGGTRMRYGQTVASFGGRLWQPSERFAPGTGEHAALVADNARRRVVFDDGSDAQDPASLAYLPDGPVRAGSLATDTLAVVDVRRGGVLLLPVRPLRIEPAARPDPPQVPGRLRIASMNIENFFNGDGAGGGFPTPRGARTDAQWHAQLAKTVAALRPLQADIVALMELENDPADGARSALAQLVAALNAAGPGDWRAIDPGHGPGGDQIRVGLIYRASRVSPVGTPKVLEGGPFDHLSRVPLLQAFRHGKGPVFAVAANHLKSKGCGTASGADADQHDGAACWNASRTDSARRLDAWLASDPTGLHVAARTLVVGDFNAYAQETPLQVLYAAGWRDAFAVVQAQAPYSYLYDGQIGRLDQALLKPELAARLRGAAEWHINADEPDSEDYAGSDVPGPWRSSDHDPLVLGLDL